MRHKNSVLWIIIGCLFISTIIGAVWVYNQKQQLDFYKLLIISTPSNLTEQFDLILDFEKEYINNQNLEGNEKMIETHVILTDTLLLHMDTMRGVLMREKNLEEDYLMLEDRVWREMLNFRETDSFSEKKTSVNNLENAIQEYKEYIKDIQAEMNIKEEA